MSTETKYVEGQAAEDQLLELVRDLLKDLGKQQAAARLGLNSALVSDLGLASLDLVELLVRCENRFDVRLSEETAHNAETPAAWLRAILASGEAATLDPAYRIPPPPSDLPLPPLECATLADVLRKLAGAEPERVHAHLLDNGSGQAITYRHLLESASAVAGGLQTFGLRRDDTVAVMLPTGPEFLYAFFGVMLAGGVPVPIYPPAEPDRIEEYAQRQIRILRDARIRFLIAFDRVQTLSQLLGLHLPGPLEVTTVPALLEARRGQPVSPVELSEIALIQYTSGSTGDPKGVVLRHASVLANIQAIGKAVQVRPGDAVVSWLPLYSDMGLISSWLFSLYHAVPITILSPLEFLNRPESWLWGIHDSRGTLSAAPNFGYELCTRRIPAWALEGMDLRSWRVAANAGEAVLPETMTRFRDRFRSLGLRPESLLPCYGLAECSVALAFPPIDRLPAVDTVCREKFETEHVACPPQPSSPALSFCSVGRPLPGHEVRIVDEDGQELEERRQGRLWFRGPSRCYGYYGVPQSPEDWMDSGDLAYWADGELYVTGRVKDCILRSGRSINPQDVETVAMEVPGVEHGGAAAFGVSDAETGTERLVIVVETRAFRPEDRARTENAIRDKVLRETGVAPDEIKLIRRGALPKTSNGKIRRAETRSRYRLGKLDFAGRPVWLQLARLARSALGGALSAALAILSTHSRSALLAVAALIAGVAVRSRPPAFQSAAGWLLRLHRRTYSLSGPSALEGNLLIANRSDILDPLGLAAALPIRFADDTALMGLGRPLAFFLSPLTLRKGVLRDRIRGALERGEAVVVFPESPVGSPPHRCRFRLAVFQTLVDGSFRLRPVAFRDSEIRVGDTLPVTGMEPVTLRESARDALAQLCP